MSETIETLEIRITNIDDRIAIIVNSLDTMMQMFDTIASKHTELGDNVQYISEELENDIAYLKDVGDGDMY